METTYSPCPGCGVLNRVRTSGRKGLPVCSRCRAPLAMEGAVSHVAGAGLKSLREKSPLPVVVDCWADWCGPCKMFAPIFSQAAQRMVGEAVFAKLDTEADPAAAADLGIRSIPTLILFQDRREKTRLSGAMLLEPFIEWLRDAIRAP